MVFIYCYRVIIHNIFWEYAFMIKILISLIIFILLYACFKLGDKDDKKVTTIIFFIIIFTLIYKLLMIIIERV